jgi:hypothetical protein
MATDFVSVANLKRTERLVSELRSQRLATSWGDDVLQFYTTLWYAWVAAQRLYKKFLLGEGPDVVMGDPLHGADHSEDNSILGDLANSDSTAVGTHPMPIDGPQPQPDASCDQQAGVSPANIPSVLSPTPNGHSAAPKTERQRQRQQERNKARRKARHQNYILGERPSQPGIDFPCPSPTCKRRLSRPGYFDHM